LSPSPSLARYHELAAKVDAFFTRVLSRHGEEMRCGSGCSDCCRARLTVTGVEAAAIREGLEALEDEARERLGEQVIAGDPSACAALQGDGRCAIYEHRPLVCRSHGLPIRLSARRALPVIDACPKNFASGGPASADPDCVLDQTTLSTLLHAVDKSHAEETGRAAGERVSLAEILRTLTGRALNGGFQ
jgi:hypothetical protein